MISGAKRSAAMPGWAGQRAVRLTGHPATKALPRRPIVPNDEACGDHTRHRPDVQTCRATRHATATRGICHMTEPAARRGMELPRAAPAPTTKRAERRGMELPREAPAPDEQTC